MDWYKFNIGDYQRATEDLTPLEHWAYRALIDQYYLRGGALPDNPTTLCRVLAASHPTHKKAICSVLTRYFIKNGDGKLHNQRCDEEIEQYQRIQDAARTAALARHAQATHTTRNAERSTDKKEVRQPPAAAVDKSTCHHLNDDGNRCGQPGTHKLHPQSKHWYCRDHREG